MMEKEAYQLHEEARMQVEEVCIGAQVVHQTHDLYTKADMVICATCGMFGRKRIVKLTRPCPKKLLTQAGRTALKRVAAGKAPMWGMKWSEAQRRQKLTRICTGVPAKSGTEAEALQLEEQAGLQEEGPRMAESGATEAGMLQEAGQPGWQEIEEEEQAEAEDDEWQAARELWGDESLGF